MIIEYLIKNKGVAMGILVGAVGGYLYYHFIGCTSGTCPITSQPVSSTLYGAMMGGLLLSTFKKENVNTKHDSSNEN